MNTGTPSPAPWLRAIGRSGPHVSALGLGTVKLGRTTGVKYPQAVRLPSNEQARALLDEAFALGVTLLDTAPAYGQSEHRLGELLAGDSRPWTISTKAGEHFDGERSSFDFSAPGLRASVEQSCRRIGRDELDIVLLHCDGIIERSDGLADALAALARCRDAGLVRAIGASTKGVEGGLAAAALAADRLCDVVMVTLHPDDRSELPVVHAAQRAGVGVLIKKALASGHGPKGQGPSGVGRAIELALRHARADAVVIGTTNIDHLREAASAARVALLQHGAHAPPNAPRVSGQ